ncbi:DapH/DapD/GlmU-related protein [Hyella patelloides]|nr:DapH/DapD/GlmU-related protein [Hyella patelloides]
MNTKNKESVSQVFALGFPINLGLELSINFISFLIPAILLIQLGKTGNIILVSFSILISFYIYPLMILLLGAICTRLLPKPKLGRLTTQEDYLKYQILAALNKFIKRTPARWIIIFPFPAYLFYKIAGAKIDVSVLQSSPDSIPDFYLVSIGKNTLLGWNCNIFGHYTPDSTNTFLGKVDIGNNVLIGAEAIVWPNVKIGDNSIVQNKSVVRPGTIIPPNEIWGGIPARKIKSIEQQTYPIPLPEIEQVETYIQELLSNDYNLKCSDKNEPLLSLGLKIEDLTRIFNKLQKRYDNLFIDVTEINTETFSVKDILATIHKWKNTK